MTQKASDSFRMGGVGSKTVLRRASDIALDLRADGVCMVSVSGRSTTCQSHALRVLEAFATPRTCGAAIDALSAATKGVDSAELTSCIEQLVEVGALCDEASQSTEPPLSLGPLFDEPAIHVEMLDDHGRTSTFLRALRKVVRPDDVVVDIGTGTGVLAIAAAQAGAKHVYAVESSRMAEAAEAVIHANGLSDRVTVVRGWSTQVTLPERATVLVAEIIGNEPLSEDALLVMWDAQRRLLAPGARMIPRAMRMQAVPVVVPDEVGARRFFTPAATARWRDWYGIEFDALIPYKGPLLTVVAPTEARGWEKLATPASFAELDFRKSETTLELVAEGTFSRAGRLGGLVLSFDLDLCADETISTSPWTREPDCHWRTPVWLVADRPDVCKGDRFEITYKFAKNMGCGGGGLTLRML